VRLTSLDIGARRITKLELHGEENCGTLLTAEKGLGHHWKKDRANRQQHAHLVYVIVAFVVHREVVMKGQTQSLVCPGCVTLVKCRIRSPLFARLLRHKRPRTISFVGRINRPFVLLTKNLFLSPLFQCQGR
jgi:hypothetical protein